MLRNRINATNKAVGKEVTPREKSPWDFGTQDPHTWSQTAGVKAFASATEENKQETSVSRGKPKHTLSKRTRSATRQHKTPNVTQFKKGGSAGGKRKRTKSGQDDRKTKRKKTTSRVSTPSKLGLVKAPAQTKKGRKRRLPTAPVKDAANKVTKKRKRVEPVFMSAKPVDKSAKPVDKSVKPVDNTAQPTMREGAPEKINPARGKQDAAVITVDETLPGAISLPPVYQAPPGVVLATPPREKRKPKLPPAPRKTQGSRPAPKYPTVKRLNLNSQIEDDFLMSPQKVSPFRLMAAPVIQQIMPVLSPLTVKTRTNTPVASDKKEEEPRKILLPHEAFEKAVEEGKLKPLDLSEASKENVAPPANNSHQPPASPSGEAAADELSQCLKSLRLSPFQTLFDDILARSRSWN